VREGSHVPETVERVREHVDESTTGNYVSYPVNRRCAPLALELHGHNVVARETRSEKRKPPQIVTGQVHDHTPTNEGARSWPY
jgi:hypothetical protein